MPGTSPEEKELSITMDDNLFEKLKKRADLSGSTVSWPVEDAVSVMLDRRSPRVEARDAFER